jgi:hypothetical protein
MLVLTTQSEYGDPANPEIWQEITHQAGGFACISFVRRCIVLPIKDSAYRGIRELTDKWEDSCVGLMGVPTLRDANSYNQDLEKLGLSCDLSYKDMMEGVYPFDTTVESLRKLTDFSLPDNLDDLLIFESDFSRMFGIVGRWQAYILGENCD